MLRNNNKIKYYIISIIGAVLGLAGLVLGLISLLK